jgi:hypothetical protein
MDEVNEQFNVPYVRLLRHLYRQCCTVKNLRDIAAIGRGKQVVPGEFLWRKQLGKLPL